jgi:hypothetical protein
MAFLGLRRKNGRRTRLKDRAFGRNGGFIVTFRRGRTERSDGRG